MCIPNGLVKGLRRVQDDPPLALGVSKSDRPDHLHLTGTNLTGGSIPVLHAIFTPIP